MKKVRVAILLRVEPLCWGVFTPFILAEENAFGSTCETTRNVRCQCRVCAAVQGELVLLNNFVGKVSRAAVEIVYSVLDMVAGWRRDGVRDRCLM